MSDRYEIRDEIGKGGLGAVYKAFDTQLHREVAMKRVLTTEHASEEEVMAAADNLIGEAKTLSSLNHPNIVTVFDVGQDEKGGFVVMELLKGETLDETVERGVLTQDDFIEVVIQTMEALIAAQAANVMHRDLKPTNVMVIWQPSGKFQTKILDFGLAKFSKTPSVQTMDQEDAVMGSIYFMAPEQFERAELDQRSDLYQIGCVYYHALTGQYPFRGETAPQVMNAHLQHRVTPLEKLRPDMSPSVCQWVMWLINRDKENRPANAQEALERFPKDPEPPGAQPLLQAIPVDESPSGATTGVQVVIPEHDAAPPARLLVTGSAPVHSGGSISPHRHATGSVDPAKRKKNLITVVSIVSALVVGIGGFLFIRNSQEKAGYERIIRLAEARNPTGGTEEVDLAVKILGSKKAPSDLKTKSEEMLSKLEGNGLDAHILKALQASDSSYVRLRLCQVLSDRAYTDAVPAMMSAFQRSKSGSSRADILNLVRRIATPKNAEALLASLSGDYSNTERRQLEEILLTIYFQQPRTESITKPLLDRLEQSKESEQFSLLTVLGSLGTDDVRDKLQEIFKQDDDTLKKNAMRAYLNWPNRGILDQIESVIKGASGENVIRQLAVEAYSRAASLPAAVPLAEKLAAWKKALEWTNGVRDYQYVFGALADNPDPESLAFAQEQSKSPSGSLAQLARQAAIKIDNLIKAAKPIDATGKLIPADDVARGNPQGANFNKEDEIFTRWKSPETWFVWHFKVGVAGDYGVEVIQADPQEDRSDFQVIVGESALNGKSQKTSSWEDFQPVALEGKVSLEAGKVYGLFLRARGVTQPRMMDIQAVRLVSP